MLKILKDVDAKHCKKCGVGSAGKEVGYLCSGNKKIYKINEEGYSSLLQGLFS